MKDMKKKHVLITGVIVMLVIVVMISTYDVKYQIQNEFHKMFDMSISDLESDYGVEVADLFEKYRNDGYDKPSVSYVKFDKNIYRMNIGTYKYSNENDSLGSVLGFQSASLYVYFDRIPVLNFDKISKIIDQPTFIANYKRPNN